MDEPNFATHEVGPRQTFNVVSQLQLENIHVNISGFQTCVSIKISKEILLTEFWKDYSISIISNEIIFFKLSLRFQNERR